MEGSSQARRRGTFVVAGALLAEAALLAPLFLHRSYEPWILGRYSLPYACVLALAVAACACATVLVLRFRRRGLRVVLASAAVLGLFLVLCEVAGQVWVRTHPGYSVIFLAPDRVLGWKQAPLLRWTWTGPYWYAREFSVPIETSSIGFRERERPFEKPPRCARIALLGDSFVEALQVPVEATAATLLEGALNWRAADAGCERRFEVLNFGVSNYGVGQYLLVWEEWARRFAPDVVFCLVAPLQMNRTPEREGAGAIATTRDRRLWIRPTLRLEEGGLVREPAADYDAFVATQDQTLRTAFSGTRSVRVPPRWFLPEIADAARRALLAVQRQADAQPEPYRQVADDVFALNLAILDELQHAVERAGGRLAVADASRYLGSSADLAHRLRDHCADQGLGYVPLSDVLLEANARGVATKWRHDGHFNRAGNEIFAAALERWLEASATLQNLCDGE